MKLSMLHKQYSHRNRHLLTYANVHILHAFLLQITPFCWFRYRYWTQYICSNRRLFAYAYMHMFHAFSWSYLHFVPCTWLPSWFKQILYLFTCCLVLTFSLSVCILQLLRYFRIFPRILFDTEFSCAPLNKFSIFSTAEFVNKFSMWYSESMRLHKYFTAAHDNRIILMNMS